MNSLRHVAASVALLSALAACSDPLEVENTNNPDRTRVLAKPTDVEALGGSIYQRVHSAHFNALARTQQGMMVAAFENASPLNNNGLNTRGGLPRVQIDNSRGNQFAPDHFNDFSIQVQAARTATQVIERARDPAFAPLLGSVARTNRLLSFAYFAYGVALGNVAMVYDSTGVPRVGDDPNTVPPFEDALPVMEFALKQLDSAETYARRSDNGFPLPATWLAQASDVSADRFVQLIRSYRARLRANIARTPAERAAVDWSAVVADASNGITADFEIVMDPINGWDRIWLSTGSHFRDINWHQMTPYIIGMADTTGAFGDWLAVPRDSRTPFLIRTPDRRFPSGETRAAQNAVGQRLLPAGVYFRNRDPGLDAANAGWQNSQYDHYRWRAFADAARRGPFPVMTNEEIDLLAAEGHLRLGNVAAAAALIDRSRTRNGLPALSGAVTSTTQAVPGGNSCVPRVPASATSNALVCGTIFEALKWEKRMETAYTGYGVWYFDSRGWGDLPEGSALEYPVPFQELDARRKPIYHLGGIGQPSGAGPGTYGYGSGTR